VSDERQYGDEYGRGHADALNDCAPDYSQYTAQGFQDYRDGYQAGLEARNTGDELHNALYPCDNCCKLTPCHTMRYTPKWRCLCPACWAEYEPPPERPPAPPLSEHPHCVPGNWQPFNRAVVRRVRADPPDVSDKRWPL
jgi:hypothetical protein